MFEPDNPPKTVRIDTVKIIVRIAHIVVTVEIKIVIPTHNCLLSVPTVGTNNFESFTITDHHIIAENASATEPFRAIAMMIVPEEEPLTVAGPE